MPIRLTPGQLVRQYTGDESLANNTIFRGAIVS
jgi:hypothetical protein